MGAEMLTWYLSLLGFVQNVRMYLTSYSTLRIYNVSFLV